MGLFSPVDHDASVLAPEKAAGRLVFVDVLRVALIVLVVAHHTGQAYGPTGGEWPITDPPIMDWLGSFFIVNAAFFMGLLFLLAGYFVPRSYDRKGARSFAMGRWKRIGVPLAFFALLVNLPVAYFLDEESSSLGEFLRASYQNGWQEVYIHLWFLGHLLLYSAIYVGWRKFSDRRPRATPTRWPVPTHATIVGFVVVLAVVTWVVRIWYPIDEWMALFFVLATEAAHLPQYLMLFVVGVVAYRGDWLRRLPSSIGVIWLIVGVAAASGVYVMRAIAPSRWADLTATGGANWGSFVYSAWEAVICAGMCVGLIVLFRELFDRTNRLLVAMAAASLAAYVLHLAFVIGAQMGVESLSWPTLAKFGFVMLVGATLAFGVGHWSRRVPGLRVILGTRSDSREAGQSAHVSRGQ